MSIDKNYHNCSQDKVMSEIQTDVRIMKHEQLNLLQSINRLCENTEKNSDETRRLSTLIGNAVVDNTEIRTRTETLERDVDRAFGEIRRFRDIDLEIIKTKIDQFQTIKERMAVNENILLAVKLLGGAVTLALVGIAVASLFGK